MGTRANREEPLPADSELVLHWRAGSTSAFETLVRRYQPRLLAFLEPRLGNREDARDVTQRAFVKIHQGIDDYRDAYPFSTWVFMIARRQAIDFQRRSGTRLRTQDQIRSLAGEEARADPGPADRLDQQERSEEIWQWARRHLSEQAFTALWLHVQEDMADGEVARAMKLTPIHVRVILHRARKKLIEIRTRARGYAGLEGEEERSTPSAHRRGACLSTEPQQPNPSTHEAL